VGIKFIGGCRGMIKGNIIRDAHWGIVIGDGGSGTTPMEDWVIANNMIHGTGKAGVGLGIQIADVNSGTKGFVISGNAIRDCGTDGMWIGGINHLVTGNLISHCGTNNSLGSGIRLVGLGGGIGSCSNLVIGNSIQPGSRTSAFHSQYAIKVEDGSTNNIIRDNWLAGFEVAPISDAGVGTILFKNHIGTNVAVRGLVQDVTFTTNCAPSMTIGAPQSLRIRLTSSSAVTLNATTSIADGYYDGQELALVGTSDINTIELPDNSNVQLNGGTSKRLGRGDVLRLVWDAALGDWLQVSPLSDN